jgi:FdhD protein
MNRMNCRKLLKFHVMNSAVQLPVIKIAGDSVCSAPDLLAIEEPLEITLAFGDPAGQAENRNLAVTMRTPGHDADLALGFLFTEGIIAGPSAVKTIQHVFAACSENKENSIRVTLHPGIIPHLGQAERNFYTSSSCGVCGKASINAIRTVSPHAVDNPAAAGPADTGEGIDPALILSLPDRLSNQQLVFAATGGLHAAALFNGIGDILLVREDVGRHNALDKLIGAALTAKDIEEVLSLHSLSRTILLLSGRASFELVQKAAMAGIPVIAAVGAPSSLAVSLAEEFGITLIGFLRKDRFNIYSGTHRINMPAYESMLV